MTQEKEKALYELTRDLANEWTNNAEHKIKEKIDDLLDKRLEQLILVLCGLEKSHSYGWKVDHCNGRSGNSPIGNMLQDALHDKLKSLTSEIHISAAEEAEIKRCAQREYLSVYKSQMKQNARRLAEIHAKEYIEKTARLALDGAAESVRLQLMEAHQ